MEIDKEPQKPDSELTQNELSQKRTGLSEHRTDLSEQRTGLSEKRTQLSDVRSHLSNERTHLSYLRTGISLISFGVTLNRFSLFLIQSNEMPRHKGRSLLHDTTNIGIGMVVIGCIMLLWSVFHFVKTADAIDNLSFKPSKWSILIFSGIIIVMGTFATAWMIMG
jgi:putative membrane protein